MAITLNRLISRGPDKVDAEIEFAQHNCLIRGGSDTGKSYIRDCLWYMLGGDKQPKHIPEDEGYDTLLLELTFDKEDLLIVRGLRGGSAAIYKGNIELPTQKWESIDEDLNDLIVRMAGAAGKQTLRSSSRKGAITSGDLRHWFLLSQPTMISEDPTSGGSHSDRPQRVAAFHVCLTGNDDSAVVLSQSKAEKDRISGRIFSAEEGIKRALSGIPPEANKEEVLKALGRVDEALTIVTEQYETRAKQLREIRSKLNETTSRFKTISSELTQSQTMLDRFNLLNAKYESDLERLGAINEGTAFYQTLDVILCPVCGSDFDQHQNSLHSPQQYRVAVSAEVKKIFELQSGLLESIKAENIRLFAKRNMANQIQSELTQLENLEKNATMGLRVEFTSDPRELALRRSDLSSQLNLFEEIERLKIEIDNLKLSKRSKPSKLTRDAYQSAIDVAAYAKNLLSSWGFKDINSVRLDTDSCDLIINERERLSYGAGRRALYLSALSIAFLIHSSTNNYPHLGFVVIDSPLKAYADPDSSEVKEIPVATITQGFYSWLALFDGPGQIIILENEKVPNSILNQFRPIQFGSDRPGFYPRLIRDNS